MMPSDLPARRKSLLVLTSNPERASFRQRIGAYLDLLAENDIAAEVAILPSGPRARRKLFKRAPEFDGVFLHKKKLNPVDAFWLRRYSRKIIYNFDDAGMYNRKRPDAYSRAHFAPFRRTVRLADMVIAGSSYLADQARPFNAAVHVLPIGLDIENYGSGPIQPPDGKVRLVWIGSRSTLAYLREILPVLEQVAESFDDIVLRVIGDDFPQESRMAIEKIHWSPESRRIGLAAADIGLAPLPDNAFTRGKCSFKVLEYSASGLPVIASPVGTNAEYVADGVTAFLVKSQQEWFARIAELIRDPEARRRMGRRGREHARRFDLKVVGVRFSELIRTGLRGGR